MSLKNFNNVQKIILIFIAIFLILSLFLFVILLNNNSEKTENKNQKIITNQEIITSQNSVVDNQIIGTPAINVVTNRDIQDKNMVKNVSNKTDYFTIKALNIKLINLIGSEQTDELINIVSPICLNTYKLTEENVLNIFNLPKLENETQYYSITITETLTVNVDNLKDVFFVNSIVRNVGNNQTVNFKVMFEINLENNTYNIYPEKYIADKHYNNIKAGDYIGIDLSENINMQNEFSYRLNIKDLEMVNEYFDIYKELLIHNENEAYQKLNSNYSKARFGSQESFVKYINNNKVNMALIKINGYKVYSSDNYTDYICTDQYNNYYIFRQQDGIMRYTVFLDTYTVELDAFKKEYESATEESKIRTQVEKVAEMVNRKDYNALYNKLNSTFKQNNFSNVSKLQEYIENNMYEMNEIKISSISASDDYYVCICSLSSLQASDESKSMNVIVKLVDYSNFEISFSFN